ncbi:hypothetical protein PIB30_023668 [Stylosanthes scabra]|uniref:Uncharacterized protein n=1 Tax=Stylosanthes scabra TaxID=79078 RepID=A0ABU6S913_9FABA|nr:hypothetical protein [Stylosanthes scabra]
MAHWVETIQLPPRVISEYDHHRHTWVVTTTTTVLQTVYLGRSAVDDPQQPIYTPLDPKPPASTEQPPPKVICISSDSESEPEEEDSKDLSEDEVSMEAAPEEEEPEGVEVPPSPELEYVPYSPNTAPRQLLVYLTNRKRIYTPRKKVGGGILVPRFL